MIPCLAIRSGEAPAAAAELKRYSTGALVLIVLGHLFLLSNLGWIPRLGPLFAQWWPAILIIVGAFMLVRR